MFPLVSYTNLLDPYDPSSESIGHITDKKLTNIGCSVQESSESPSFNYIFELSKVWCQTCLFTSYLNRRA